MLRTGCGGFLPRLLSPSRSPRRPAGPAGCGLRGPGLCGLPGGGQPLPGAPHRRGLLRRDGPRAGHAAAGGGRDPLAVDVAPGLLRGGGLPSAICATVTATSSGTRPGGACPARAFARYAPACWRRAASSASRAACRSARAAAIRSARDAPPHPAGSTAGPHSPSPGSTPRHSRDSRRPRRRRPRRGRGPRSRTRRPRRRPPAAPGGTASAAPPGSGWPPWTRPPRSWSRPPRSPAAGPAPPPRTHTAPA